MSDKVEIGGDNYGAFNVGGKVEGAMSGATVTSGTGNTVTMATDLVALLDRLRAEVAAERPAKQEVIEDNLADLASDAENLRDGKEVSGEIARSRWAKAKGLLAGVAQVTEIVAKIGEHVQKLFAS